MQQQTAHACSVSMPFFFFFFTCPVTQIWYVEKHALLIAMDAARVGEIPLEHKRLRRKKWNINYILSCFFPPFGKQQHNKITRFEGILPPAELQQLGKQKKRSNLQGESFG